MTRTENTTDATSLNEPPEGPSPNVAPEPCYPTVGLGASAGGLEALTEFFQTLPADSGLAFVVVSHLDPEHKSALGEILARITPMPVREVDAPMPVEPNRVYVIPSNKGLTLVHGILQPVPRSDVRGIHMPVDIFLRSLAEDCKDQAIGVILSGTGADGTLGLKAIKEVGGLTFAQDDTAKHTGMPRSAMAAGCVDAVLPPAKIAAELLRIARHPRQIRFPPIPAPVEQIEGDAFHQILRLLSNATGVDFLHYKHSTLRRRLERRLVLRRLQSLTEYLQCLRDDRTEVQTLFEEVLIPVTSFFRDPEVFEALKTVVFPRMLEKRPAGAPVRIWVPGCATGEEAYSLAICVLEYLGARPDAPPIKIFATDISERAVEVARAGAYSEAIAAEVSAERLQRFFQKTDRGYQISKTIRDLCVFARQDVTKDPPFSQLDLISCRNVLIYLGPALQNRVLPILHYALKPGGVLLLGSSETVGSFTDLFEVLDKKNRFSVRTAVPSRLTFEYTPGGGPAGAKVLLHPSSGGGGGDPGRTLADVYREADRVVLARYAPVGVVVDENLRVVQFRGDTGQCLKPAPGPPTADLLQMAREGLLGDLHAVFLRAKQESAPTRAEGVQVRTNDHFQEFHLEVIPITTPVLQTRYFVVLFEEAQPLSTSGEPSRTGAAWSGEPSRTGVARLAAPTRRAPAPEEPSAKDQEIGRLKRELDAGKAYLQSVIEEKEASNEELRAANEEIISANEELQSTNEELETAKEELQATNEELTTVNDELQSRIRVANQLGDDLVNLIETTNIPIVVLGADLGIRRFTPSAQRVLNLRAGDVGRPIHELRLRVNIPDLEQLVHEVIDTLEIKQREVKDEAGAWHKLYLRPYKTLEHKIGGVVLMLIDIEALKRRERQIEESRDYAVSIVETVREPLIVLDGRLRVQTANRAFYQMFQVTPAETEGQLIYDLGGRQWIIPGLRTLLEEIVPQNRHFENFEMEHDFPKLGRRSMLLNAHRLMRREGEPSELILLAIEDITARRLAEDEARRLARLVEASDDAVYGEALDGTITSWNRGAERLFGYTAQEAVGQSVFMLVSAEGVAVARQALERNRQGEAVEHLETRRVRKDGREVEVSLTLSPVKDSAGQVTGVAVIAHDMTTRKRMEEAIRDSESKLRTVVETAVDAVITIDERGVIDSANPATERMFGYTAAEMLGHNVTLLMPSPYQEEHPGYLARYLQTGEKRIIGIGREVQGRRKDGLTFPLDLAVSEFQNQGRRMFTGVLRDISARKQLEREVLEVATLEQRRIGQQLHDSTSQELTALTLLAETLAEALEGRVPAESTLAAKVVEGLKRAGSQLRDISRGLIPVEVDARGLQAALAELATRTSELPGVTCTFACQEPLALEDNQTATHLFYVAQEAVTNALRHGKATHITISLESAERFLTLRIQDNGSGFPSGPVADKGMGLKIMAYRAGLINARLAVTPAAPSGAVVICSLIRGITDGPQPEEGSLSGRQGPDRGRPPRRA